MSNKNIDNEKFNNPFSALEGLSVSKTKKPEKKTDPVVIQSPGPVVPEKEGDVDFDLAMAGLGVKVIEQSGLDRPLAVSVDKNEQADAGRGEEADRGGGGGGGFARPRRQKQLRRGEVLPEAELDLHGVRAEEVHDRVGWFLENAIFHGFEAVRIITGKGSRSVDGPVLRPLVESYLDGPGRNSVVEWMRAPQRQGGEGAIVAFLRLGGK